jgi:hypothetical protein
MTRLGIRADSMGWRGRFGRDAIAPNYLLRVELGSFLQRLQEMPPLEERCRA